MPTPFHHRRFSLSAVIAFLLPLVLCYALPAAAGPAPAVDPIADGLHAAPLRFLEDASGEMSFEQALSRRERWQTYPGERFNQGFGDSAWWLELTVTDVAGAGPERPLLSVDTALLEELDVWFLQDGQVVARHRLGLDRPFENRPVAHRHFVMPLPLHPAGATDVVLRVKTAASVNVPLSISSATDFWHRNLATSVMFGMYVGAMGLIALYNLLLFIAIRDIAYLFYVLYVVPLGFTAVVYEGWANQYLWPGMVDGGLELLSFMFASNILGMLLFTRRFLEVPAISPRLRQVFDAVLAVAGVTWISIVAGLPYAIGGKLVILLFLLLGPVCLAAGVLGLKRGVNSAARFYLGAWSLLFAGGVLLILGRLDVIPTNAFTEAGVQIGSVLEALMLSFALANRINRERALRIEARQISLAAQAESRAKSRMLASMSHEIRTPMNGIVGMTELLKDTGLTAVQKKYVHVIDSSGRALLHLIDDILDLSRLSAGRLKLEKISFDLPELMHDTVTMFTFEARNKDLNVRSSLDDNVPRRMLADPHRLRQILVNLLGNAIKFTDAGEVTVRVSRVDQEAVSERATVHLRFSVKDTGIGIPPDRQAALFEAFQQADDSIARRHGGSGLGLNICRELVTLMGGEIGVRSESGSGSEFWFTVEAATAPAAAGTTDTDSTAGPEGKAGSDEPANALRPTTPPLRSPPVVEAAPSASSTLSALIVEDNAVNRMVAVGLLHRLGVTSAIAEDGVAGLEYFREHHSDIDLILMDGQMPLMDGYECARAIRAFEAARNLPRTPIHALSAHAGEEHIRRSRDAGMDGHLNKPIDVNTLQRVIASLDGGAAASSA